MADLQQQRYALQRELGTGAMGSVWLATDTLLGRPVAIKYLKTPDNVSHKDLFISEARTLASLNHPNITLIYDAVFDEENNQFYLVMEYVEGQPLISLIEGWSAPLPLQNTLDIAIGVLQALQYAHNKNIVHRDIKPENVIIQKEGVKLTDFGLASLVSLLSENTNYMAGTPAYMSPEQIESLPVDGRADLYALGVMLFEMLSGGHKPFEQYIHLSELLDAHLKKAPPSLRAIAPEVPLALERAVMQLLAKEPDERYPSAKVVIDILRSIEARQKFSQLHLNLLDLEIKPLVDREAELKQLDAIWTESRQGAKPRLLVVQGEMGIGKTSLVAEFLGHYVIDEGFVALMGRSDQSGIPYTPFAEILATIISKNLSSLITSQQIDQFIQHIPDLARLLDISDGPKSVLETSLALQDRPTNQEVETQQPSNHRPNKLFNTDTGQLRWQFFTTILDILTTLGPAVLVFEDADFLDEASVALTQFLLRRGKLPLLVIVTCQQEFQTIPWLDAFVPNEKTLITLSPLSKSALEQQLINAIGGPIDEQAISFIKQRSQGNPLRAEETIRQLLDSQELQRDEDGQWYYLPINHVSKKQDSSELSMFPRRLANLTNMSRRALTLAALIEPMPEFDFDIWVALLGGKSQLELAQRARDEAVDKRLLRQIDNNRYAFRPPDLARKLVATLSENDRRDLNHQIAEILRQKHKDPLLVAHHYEQAGLMSDAAHYLEVAGAEAMANQAIKAAIIYYKRAVMLTGSRSAYKTLGQLYRQERKWVNSLQSLQYALELAEEADDVIDQAHILNELSYTLWLYDDYEEAYEPAAAVLELPDVSETQQAIAKSHLGMIAWLTGRLTEAENRCQEAIDILKINDGVELAEAYQRLGLAHLSQGKLSTARIDFGQVLALSEQRQDDRQRDDAFINLGQVAIEQGAFEQAVSYLNAAKQLAESGDHPESRLLIYKNYGRLFLYQQRFDEALSWLTRSLRLALQIIKHRAYGLSDIYRLIAQTSLGRGEVKLALSAATDALKLVKAAGNREHVALCQATLAQIYTAQGDIETAAAMYQEALALFEEIGSRSGLARTQFYYAQFLARQGKTDEAESLEQKARAKANELGLYLPTG